MRIRTGANISVWITRTEPSASETAQRLTALGYHPIVAPLLEISPPDMCPALPLPDSIIVFTSKNGVRAFCDLTDQRAGPVVTVGDATAETARANGFEDVLSAQGTSEDVTTLIQKTYPKKRPIYHAAGAHVRGSICEDLRAVGYQAERALLYHSKPVTQIQEILPDAADVIWLYSPQAAKTLAYFAPTFKSALANIKCVSISKATDSALGDLTCAGRFIAQHPNESAMTEQLRLCT